MADTIINNNNIANEHDTTRIEVAMQECILYLSCTTKYKLPFFLNRLYEENPNPNPNRKG